MLSSQYDLADAPRVVVPFTLEVWNENLDHWEDDNGNECSAPDGPPYWAEDSYHFTREGAEAAQLKYADCETRIVEDGEYDAYKFYPRPSGLGETVTA